MKPDPAFATSPICVDDKDYEFSVDPDIITLVESDPFHGYESETVVAHLTKLNDIATLFTNDEKSRYYYILKIFPFTLKGDGKIWFNSLDPGCVHSPQDMIYYFSTKYFPAHKKQAALREIYNFVQIEEESLPKAWGRLLKLLNALPDHPLNKPEILDIFYNGLTDASKDYLDSCAGSLFRERTPDEAEILLNNMLTNENNWAPLELASEPAPAPITEPIPKPTPKKRGVLFLSPEDMQEAKKSMKEKGIKAEDVKNLPPIEEIHGLNLPPVEETYDLNPLPILEPLGLDNPTQVVKVNSLYRYDRAEIPLTKFASQCLDEFDNFIVKQENFNAYFGRQLKYNSNMLKHLGDYMANVRGELKLISKHASMVTTQVEQVLKAQNGLLNEMTIKKNDYAIRVATRTGRMTQEPLYPEGHPKRIEQDSQRNNIDAPSSSKRKKKKNDRTLQTSSEPITEPPDNPNDISMSDAETQSGNEHEPSENVNDDVHDDAQPSNDNDVEIEPAVDLDNPQSKNQRYDKRVFVARKHGKEREPWVQKPMPFPPKPSKKKDDEDFERFAEMIRPIFLCMRLTDVLKTNPYAKYMKDIITNKRKIPEAEISTMLANYTFKGGIPKKLGDPGVPTIPCSIKRNYVKTALCDLGAGVSVMPLSLYHRLDLNKLTPTEISLQMVDKLIAIPVGICEDVPVVVANVTILMNFVILDIPEDDSMSIILGRPFLNTAGAVIDCNKGNVTFHVNGNEHTVHFPRKQPQVHNINSIGKIPSIIFGGFEFPLPTVKKKYDIIIVGDVHIPVEVTKCYSKILRFHVIRNEFVNKT